MPGNDTLTSMLEWQAIWRVPPYDEQTDSITFSVPAAPREGCVGELDWRRSPTAFYSPAYPARLGVAHNACVCSRNGQLVWSEDVTAALGAGCRPRLVGECKVVRTTRVMAGMSLVGQAWPAAHVGHQQECVFPMMRLVDIGLAERMLYVRPEGRRWVGEGPDGVPFVRGLLAAMRHRMPTLEVAAQEVESVSGTLTITGDFEGETLEIPIIQGGAGPQLTLGDMAVDFGRGRVERHVCRLQRGHVALCRVRVLWRVEDRERRGDRHAPPIDRDVSERAEWPDDRLYGDEDAVEEAWSYA